jgi:soluble cytochrome b562
MPLLWFPLAVILYAVLRRDRGMPTPDYSRMVLQRLELMDDKLNRLLGMALGDAKRDIEMATAQEKFKQELQELKATIKEYTSNVATRVEDAVAKAREAWEADNQKAFEEATQELDTLQQELQKEEGEFEPSGN